MLLKVRRKPIPFPYTFPVSYRYASYPIASGGEGVILHRIASPRTYIVIVLRRY